MTVHLSPEGVVRLDGDCGVEDAEALVQQLLATPGAMVDWRGCTAAHTAVIQVLLVFTPTLHGPPASPFLRDLVAPALLSQL